MLGVGVLYAGFVIVLLGLVCTLKPVQTLRIRKRRTGLLVLALGLTVVVLGSVLPSGETRVVAPRTRLDEFLPTYQFSEFHQVEISAPKGRVYAAIKQLPPEEIRFFRTLTWIRRLGQAGPASMLNPPEHQPILDTALRTGFLELADDPTAELVIGAMGASAGTLPRKPTPDDFKTLNGPGMVKIAMNFRIEELDAAHCLLTTETRVYATDPVMRSRFARYWRVIYPGSALIRRMWLRAIKRRAEGSLHAAG